MTLYNTPLGQIINCRLVTPGDRGFLLEVYAASREIELSMVPWDIAQKRAFVEHQFDAQTSYYENEYRETRHEVILHSEVPVGRLFVSRGEPQRIAILDIAVLPEYRNKGIASHLIRELQNEASETGKSLGIFIEGFNPSQALFRKLGFEMTSDSTLHLHFEWSNPT